MIWLEPFVIQIRTGEKIEAKESSLDREVLEEELYLYFSGGKDDWRKFGEIWQGARAILAVREAILLLMR